MGKFLSLAFIGYFLSACGSETRTPKIEKYGLIANIPEASGICYSQKRDSIFVVSDKGVIVELDTNGVVKRDKSLNSLSKHDFEGVACDDAKNSLLIAVEGADNILRVDQENLNVQKDINIERGDILQKDKEFGLEGIALLNGKVFLSNQSFTLYNQGDDPSVVFTIDSLTSAKPNIDKIYDHGFTDISGLSFYQGFLYMVSDSANMLIKYDVEKEETVFTKQLPKFSIEGIAFDTRNNIFFADDDNGRIYKYETKQYGI